MFDMRKLVAAAVAVSIVFGVPALMQGQNSVLPLQPGQVRQEEAEKLVAVLQSDAALFDKVMACKRLAVIGDAEAVPALTALLDDEKLAHYARYGLAPIPNPAVDDALRSSLPQLHGKFLVGVINSIGFRKDAKAVDELAKFLGDSDPETAAAAAAALGRIGTAKTAKVLEQTLNSAPPAVQTSVADACFACAEELLTRGQRKEATALYDAVRKADLPKHLRVAATRGAILSLQSAGIPLLVEQLRADDKAFFGVGLRAAHELDAGAVPQALLAELDKAPPRRQALLILTLGELGDTVALSALLEAAQGGSAEVRLAAVRSLGRLGDASAVPVLMDAAVQPGAELADAARAALTGLPGNDVDAAIVAGLGGGDREIRRVVIELVGRRRISSAVGRLLRAADDPDEKIRLAAIKALGQTVELENLTVLTNRAISPKTASEKAGVQEALTVASARMPDKEQCAERLIAELSKAPLPEKILLLELLGVVGGDKSLEFVSTSARDANEQIQDAATRVLGEWMSADAAPALLDLAKTLDNNKYKIRALRGYIRIPRQFGLPTEQRLVMCRKAMETAQRGEERKLVLEVLGRIPSSESLSLAVSYLDAPTLKAVARKAAVDVAERIVHSDPEAVAKAMRQVLDGRVGARTASRAKTLLERAEK